MAEGLARQHFGGRVRVQSAGSHPSRVHPCAVRAMAEVGVDLAGQRSKSVDTVDADSVDTVITLCAEEVCPVFLGKAARLHWGLPDPAAGGGSDDELMAGFRAVRDELARRIAGLGGS